ncbi:MAG: SDR family oxidoreductase [Alphaproteobacteria bacterium]|nr:SDR family oxidoreductase [Alphaproteobacteria bacterium]
MIGPRDLFDLGGSVALVTGGSSGLGRRIGFALARAGAAVVLLARRADKLEAARDEITEAGGRAACMAADIEDTAALEGIAATVGQAFGAPDILVNAAGVNLREPASDVTIDSWNRTLALNLGAPFFLSRALVPGMRQKGRGKIVNIASLQSCRAFANGIAYGASKGGIVQLTRAMAEAWSRFGITCNALAPGFFPTELTAPLYGDEAMLQRLAAQTAIGRNGELGDIDGPAIFLAAPASDYITGQVIFVDGGFTAK